MASYSMETSGDSCYPDSTVLINKLGIRDQEQLDEAETLILGVQSIKFELKPFSEPLNFQYYLRIHVFLFGELYEWAGKLRAIDISKQHTHFCPATDIADVGEKMFQRIGGMNYLSNLPRDIFIHEFADFYNSLNYLHPFREGNGRTQRLYFRQLAERAGYHLNFTRVDADRMLVATIHAASGVMDDLLQIFNEIIE